MDNPNNTRWHKSSYSGTNNNCVEVRTGTGPVGVRDTKDQDCGQLVVAPSSWAAFLRKVAD
jgi:hypothetical protein